MSDLPIELGRRIAAECPEAYFVGGCVRDLLRGEAIKDVDLSLAGDTHRIGRALAKEFSGHVFWLHQEEGVVRVVLPEHGGLQLDLSPLRGTIEQDLHTRDLTINALAIAAADGLRVDAPIIDTEGGQADLEARTVRFCSPESPVKDPLRTMRALRFRWKLDFRLAEGATELIRECVPLLSRVSVERVRDELFQLLGIAQPHLALDECLSFGMGRWLTGVDAHATQGDGWAGPAGQVESILELLRNTPPDLHRVLQTQPTPPRSRRELLFWAAAIQGFGAAVVPDAAARYLALSNDEKQLIVKGLSGAAQIVRLECWPVPGRVRYRLFRSVSAAGPEAVLLASARAGEWTNAHAELLDEALRRHFWPEAPLLTGLEVMQLLNVGPGPQIGQTLEEIEEARADGILRTKPDAVEWLRTRNHTVAPAHR